MPPSTRTSDIRKRLRRHSDTVVEKTRKQPQKSPTKKHPSPTKAKKNDVEPVKKRLRSAGDYKLSAPFEELSKQKKSTPKVSPTKKSPKKTPIKLDDAKTPKSSRKSTTETKLKKKEKPIKQEVLSETRTPSPKNQRLTRSAEKPTTSSNKKLSKTPKSAKKPSSSKKLVQVKKEPDSEPRRTQPTLNRRLTTIKLELPDGFASTSLNIPKTPRGTLRFFEPDTPPVRNQNVFHNCAVCKEATHLLTADYKEQLLRNEVKNIVLGVDELTSSEDPALQCNSCKKHFHLVCVYNEILIQNWAVSNPKLFVCQECIRCTRCIEPIFDPGNVQCVMCGQAFHETCKPETRFEHDLSLFFCNNNTTNPHNSSNYLQKIENWNRNSWYCNLCEENLLNILDYKQVNKSNENDIKSIDQPSTSKKSNKRNLNQSHEIAKSKKTNASRRSDLNKSIESPVHKKAKTNASDSSPTRKLRQTDSRKQPESPTKSHSPSKSAKLSPTKTESPNKSNRSKEVTDEELEKRRIASLNKLKDSIRYDGDYQCIAAQESTFSRLNDEYLNEEEELNEPKLEHYVPFASVGSSLNKHKEPTDATFFYGPIAYKPRFSQFLHLIYPEYERLSFCRRCLLALPSPASLLEHDSACTTLHPPGNLIYKEKNISVWEVVGKKEKTYSRRLALFAKTFIGSKTVFFEVEQFTFYVLTETEGSASFMAGYFSKEIKPTANNNLSCLLILPWLQRKNYGMFLIDLSYQLSLRERKIGSPEHPLSDAGLKTYRQYWYSVIMSWLREKLYHNEKIDLIELKEQRGIELRDILETMIIADMTFILDDKLQINVETPLYTMLSSLRRRYVKPKLLQVKTHAGPFTTYN